MTTRIRVAVQLPATTYREPGDDAIQRVLQAANDVVDNKGTGVLVWEPVGYQTMFRAVPELANTWEPHASVNVFNASRAEHILQDTVYTTTAVRTAPKLPTTVHLLTTATKKITNASVRWQPLPAGATDEPGELRAIGMTDAGPVTAFIDVMAERSRHSGVDPTTS